MNNYQNLSNSGVECLAFKSDGAAGTYWTITDVDGNMMMVNVLLLPPSITAATPCAFFYQVTPIYPIQELGGNQGLPDPDHIHHPPPVVSQSLSANQAPDCISVIIAQLWANLAATTELQLENQQIRTEICKIIHEIINTSSILGKKSPSSKWCLILSSGKEARILQSCHDELWNHHLKSPCEITADLYTKMVQGYGILWRRYKQILKSHAVLKDNLQHLMKQLTNTLSDWSNNDCSLLLLLFSSVSSRSVNVAINYINIKVPDKVAIAISMWQSTEEKKRENDNEIPIVGPRI
ncbi:hypothetical protein BDM02DRAFT_3133432, partial [Thelephora ganbajun]